MCKIRKLKVNAGKTKAMIFKRRESEVLESTMPYRMNKFFINAAILSLYGNHITGFIIVSRTILHQHSHQRMLGYGRLAIFFSFFFFIISLVLQKNAIPTKET